MMTTIETYVRKGQGSLRKWALKPECVSASKLGVCFLSGITLSAASLAGVPQPLAMGLVCALSGWAAVSAALGGALGYWLFWGNAGVQGLCWLGLALLAALALGKRRILDESPLLMMSIAGLIVSATGLGFQIWRGDGATIPQYLLRIAIGASSSKLFEVVRERRDTLADWLGVGCLLLGLSQIAPFGFSLGYVVAGMMAALGALPGVALAGLALDLSQIGKISMTAVLSLAWLGRSALVGRRWVPRLAPACACLLVTGLAAQGEWMPFFGLLAGGCLSVLIPAIPAPTRPRGETGLTQVRLEVMAGVLSETQKILLEAPGIPIDEEALLCRTRERACGSCPNRKTCRDRLQPLPESLLHSPLVEVSALSIACKKPGRMILELRRTQEQYRSLRADRERQREYRWAVTQQYQFLSDFLRQQSDGLVRRARYLKPRFTPELAICSAGRESANGDRCAGFAGTGCRYYVVLCDGMGTGLGAAQEGQTALSLLRQMLTAGFPAEYALRSINSLLVLRGRAAAVTVDLLEIHLDSGRAAIYKWGAAPSWLLGAGGAEKIGTAEPPPGLSVTEGRETVERLSLRRGEMLIMTSDGVGVGDALGRIRGFASLPPGEVAARLLEAGGENREDDATVAAIRLIGGVLST